MKKYRKEIQLGDGRRHDFVYDGALAELCPVINTATVNIAIVNYWLHISDGSKMHLTTDAYLEEIKKVTGAKPNSIIATALAFNAGMHAKPIANIRDTGIDYEDESRYD